MESIQSACVNMFIRKTRLFAPEYGGQLVLTVRRLALAIH
jgi:hypothetical protein